MQLMTFNSLLMFDIVFIFFLFLVGVTCLVYYLPPRELPPPPLVPSAASDHNDHPTTTHTTAAGGTITCAHHQHRRHHQHLHHGCIERCGHRSPVAGDVAAATVAPAAAGMMVQSCAAAARRISGEGGTPVLVQNERSTSAGSSPSGNPMESDSFGASQGRRLERPLRLECCSVADRQQGGTSVVPAFQTCQYHGISYGLSPICHQYQHQQQQQQWLASEAKTHQTPNGVVHDDEGTIEEVLLLDCSSLNQVLVMRHDSLSVNTGNSPTSSNNNNNNSNRSDGSSSRIVLQETPPPPPPAYHEQRLELGCCNSNQPGQQLQFERFVQIEVDSSSIDGGGGVSSKVAAAAAAATPCCYVRAKASDIKECHGPICDV
ncbi:hypothetical protein AND_000817 [Anopheles darlingi]|uniref:Uncharacterized protein n=1 Tax=Anopheles darlingi TaxID=43151 RepID=W5JW62_ANODA|nr:hypothetical protein AND_000817 [Anopheles darlingi]